MKNSNGFKALQTLKEQYQIEHENHVKKHGSVEIN
jgi:hypothetical protein